MSTLSTPSSARTFPMHRALCISEVISLICHSIASSSGILGKPSLARFARTCSTFTEPALDALWESQQSLGPLIRIMPADLWTTVPDINSGYRAELISFRRGLVDSDWSPRLEHYGSKIRHLDQSAWTPIIVHEDVFMAISAYRPTHVLVPNLRSVSLDLGHPHFLNAILFFQSILGASVQKMFIRYRGESEASSVPALLSVIPRLCPNILSFCVVGSTALSAGSLSTPYHCLCSLHNLRKVNVSITGSTPTEEEEMIIHLGRLSFLESWCSVDIPSTFKCRFLTSDGQRFKNLREFSFRTVNWEIATKTIRDMRCAFTRLVVQVNDFHTEEPRLPAFVKFLDTFEGHPAITSLSELNLSGSAEFHERSIDTGKSFSETMRTLFLFKSLRRLEVTVPAVSLLDNSWLSEAAVTWPGLQHLQLDGGGTPQMTLAGWIPILKHCPELKELHISSLWRPFSTELVAGVWNARVTDILMQDSEIESPTAIFRCLAIMFPRLRTVYNDGEEEQREDWKELQEMLDNSAECSQWYSEVFDE